MIKTVAATLFILGLTALPVTANRYSDVVPQGVTVKSDPPAMLPPKGYTSQWWIAPNGCEYSRAGRPGEIVWYLIINTARRGCEAYLVERGFSDAY